jgi:hypothetical protein
VVGRDERLDGRVLDDAREAAGGQRDENQQREDDGETLGVAVIMAEKLRGLFLGSW